MCLYLLGRTWIRLRFEAKSALFVLDSETQLTKPKFNCFWKRHCCYDCTVFFNFLCAYLRFKTNGSVHYCRSEDGNEFMCGVVKSRVQ